MKRNLNRIDGRTVLFLTVAACLVSFLSTNFFAHALYTIGFVILLCYYGIMGKAIGTFAVYILALLGLIFGTRYNIKFPSPLLFSMVYKLVLPMLPIYLLNQIPAGKLTASIRKLPISKKVMLVLIVMLRFAPTVVQEFRNVSEAMRVRGFLSGAVKVLRHPLNTLEYAVVPMVFRALTIADELSVSAIVRGIESPCKKESYHKSKIGIRDTILMIACTAAGIVCSIV